VEAALLVAGYRHGRRAAPIVTVERLAAKPGEFVAVIGPNGAGKSTLLRTLIGTQPALGGEVWLGGTPLGRLDRAERARRVAVVLTDRVEAGLLTVGDVVSLGRHPHTGWSGRLGRPDEVVARAAAARLGVLGQWDRRFEELSDGQRQRALVARALAQQPGLLVLDEPTAFLDVTGRMELTAALADLAHVDRLAVIASTHDLDLALTHADRVWLVDRGVLIEASPEAVVVDGLLSAAFDNDAVAFDLGTATFTARRRAGRPIAVSSPVVARLVRRLGATPIDAGGDAADAWRIEALADAPGWRLHDGSGVHVAPTIDELAAVVRTLLAADPSVEPRGAP
jgi:iron complex transport system ATP-binding protein